MCVDIFFLLICSVLSVSISSGTCCRYSCRAPPILLRHSVGMSLGSMKSCSFIVGESGGG